MCVFSSRCTRCKHTSTMPRTFSDTPSCSLAVAANAMRARFRSSSSHAQHAKAISLLSSTCNALTILLLLPAILLHSRQTLAYRRSFGARVSACRRSVREADARSSRSLSCVIVAPNAHSQCATSSSVFMALEETTRNVQSAARLVLNRTTPSCQPRRSRPSRPPRSFVLIARL